MTEGQYESRDKREKEREMGAVRGGRRKKDWSRGRVGENEKEERKGKKKL